jgi:hypothetical protein
MMEVEAGNTETAQRKRMDGQGHGEREDNQLSCIASQLGEMYTTRWECSHMRFTAQKVKNPTNRKGNQRRNGTK